MAFEALNNAGAAKADLLVILNDNDMSISEPVGALNNHLARLLSSRVYDNVRRGGKEVLSLLPPVRQFAKRLESHTKGMVLPGTMFEELGFNYIGPIDGHDLDALVATLENVKELKGPQFLHVDHAQGPRLCAGRGRPDPLPRRHAIRPVGRHRTESRRQADVHADLRRLGMRHGGDAIRGWFASRRPCAKGPGWCASRRSIRTGISTSASPSSMR